MKKWLMLLCSLTLVFSGCTASPDQASSSAPQNGQEANSDEAVSTGEEKPEKEESDEERKFKEWSQTFVQQLCEQDYTTCHNYFEHPEDYGIDISKSSLTLGDFVDPQEIKDFDQETLKTLESFDRDSLSSVNAQILDQLLWEYSLAVRSGDEKFDYIGNIWSSMSGLQSSLVTYFSEYQLYDEKGVEDLIALIEDVPDYVDKAIAYSRKQAELGYLSLDLDSLTEDCEEVLDSQKNSPVTQELDSEVDTLMLDQDKADALKKRIHQALDESFFPSFQTIINEMTLLKDDIKPFSGLADKKNGKEYYEMLLEHYAGEKLDIDDTIDLLNDRMDELTDTFADLMKKDSGAASRGLYLSTDFKNTADIMPFLDEHYSQSFPVLDAMDYELKPLSPEQSSEGVLAYFVVPAIDSTRPYEIRYNVEDYGDDPSDFQLYDTFAHEGIPGHMYQTQYDHQHFTETIQYFQNCMGFQEGYAVYAAQQAQSWLDLNEKELQAYQLNELYTQYMALVMDLQINGQGMSLEEFTDEYGEGLEAMYNQLSENPGVFFSYYYGNYRIQQLREKAMDALGDRFDEVDFNQALLQAGSVNFDIVEQNIEAYIQSASTKKS